ncbi:MAG: diguanylate cyclase [Desulfovibrionaceae bacterium]|nr:diguanylate cyclase [Desulfovibrionaceae bacterium]
MKRFAAFLALLLCAFSATGYAAASNKTGPLAAIKTYRDIPGVTGEEISAIEALKAARHRFSYGALYSAEAFILPSGFYGGFTAQFCELLSELFGIRFVLELYDRDELLDRLDSRAADFTGELTPTEERKQRYAMTLPIAQRSLRLFTSADSDKIRTEVDVKGCKIGNFTDAATVDSIRKAYPGVPFVQVDIDQYEKGVRMILLGEIDAFVIEAAADPAFEAYAVVVRSFPFFPLAYNAVAMATANPALAPVISVVNKYLAAGGIDKLYELYQEGDVEYTKYKLRRSFTKEEEDYVDGLQERRAAIGVGFEYDNYPVSFYNRAERAFQGIAADVLAEIGKLTGMRFEVATTKDTTWPEIFEKIKAGEIHMVAQLLRSEARREHFIWSAAPYARSYYAIISRTEYPNLAAYQVARTPVGVVKQSGYADIYRETFPNNNNLKEYDTFEECLAALDKGEVDLLMASAHMLLAQTNYREKSGLKMNIKLGAPMDSYFGFHKDNAVLCSVIDKAQQYVKTDEIEARWTSRVFDYSKKLADNLSVYVSVLGAILIITAFLLVKNVMLSRQLKEIASKDGLTGIFNRRYFLELGVLLLERSLRTGEASFIILFDLDRFKAINDNYGHQAGDAVLKETARRVQAIIRPYDIFGRYGGEEFIILMPGINTADVLHAVERIRLDLHKAPVLFKDSAIPVSASFGIACAAPMRDMDTAISYADKALYQAKNAGGNEVVFYRHGDCA